MQNSRIYIPEGYRSLLNPRQTQMAIKKIKDFFQRDLAIQLDLTRVTAPLFVKKSSGLNDDLNGVERPVSFEIAGAEGEVQIVHSLAKWKRYALGAYGFERGEGLYTDMNAIRRDEVTDNLHSVFVDQWDWERVIDRSERNEATLRGTVNKIYAALRHTEKYIADDYAFAARLLPEEITFVKASELEEKYPSLTPKEREYRAVREHGAIFIEGIGGKLKSGKPHDGRAPDYDDWALNGDIIVYYPVLDTALELSSMGIRVDEISLMRQLNEAGCLERASLPFHRALLEGKLPYTIGGGIGQSRICMFFLRKAHIGEVQASVWDDETLRVCREAGVNLF
ncbi:MAG: aspartate--ammonia ligase [Clostridia bacterium]|nr:aspartate--ammonia ligase [Clostridia bacterium]